jgi:hypothetical protein
MAERAKCSTKNWCECIMRLLISEDLAHILRLKMLNNREIAGKV